MRVAVIVNPAARKGGALARWPAILNFLGQDVSEASDVAASRDALARLLDDVREPVVARPMETA